MDAVGFLIALLLFAVYVLAMVSIWRAPFRALGVLVAGMAFHNIMIMVLLELGTPAVVIRVVQSWKEGVLALLLIIALRLGWRAWRARTMPKLLPSDLVAIAFVLITCMYLLLPMSILASEGNIVQRLVSFRATLLMPLLYAYGRIFWSGKREDLLWVVRVVLGSAGLVGIFGLFELWFVPTSDWIGWGVNLFSQWLGFNYQGPEGLPENFFQTTDAGLALRRMVSTYISPLGLAYTGLLIVPIAATALVLKKRQSGLPIWFRWTTFTLLILGILFSVTRGALLIMVVEFALLTLMLGRRLIMTSLAVVLCVLFIFFDYINVGPLVSSTLYNIRLPAGYVLLHDALWTSGDELGISSGSDTDSSSGGNQTGPQGGSNGGLLGRMITQQDPSTVGHLAALRTGLQYAWLHPLGAGLGSASVRYFSSSNPPGNARPMESALLTVFGELGVVGGLLYLGMYSLGVLHGVRAYFRHRSDNPLLASLPLVAFVGGLALVPIMITSAIWGNFSLTFLFWWCVGLSATLFYHPGSAGSER